MLLSEIIYNIKNLRAGGLQSDDENISDEQYAFIINYYRAQLIKQEIEKGKNVKDLYIQNLGKVAISKADKNECCDVSNCALRTTLKIPKPVESTTGLNLTFVGLLNGTPFQRYTFNSSIWKKYNKYTKNSPGYYYQNGYIYLLNVPNIMLSYINIQGIFENPQEAVGFSTCKCPDNNTECISGFDFEYPIPPYWIDTIIKMMATSELKLALNTLDTTNNGLSDTSIVTDK
ncbi:MAG: hypothetical protein WC942_04970 [Clostridia bacterium]|jgi:hypothetical protein